VDYFRAMQIPLVAGRFFSQQDSMEMPRTAIIDEKFARRFWPHNDAIGKHLWFDPKKPITIVGVVGVVKQYGLETDGKIATYFPLQQELDSGMFLVVRSSSEDAGLSAGIVREIHAVDPSIVVYGFRTMQDRLYGSLARQRFSSTMLGAFCGLRFAAGLRGPLRRDVVSGHTEHARYRDSARVRRAVRKYTRPGRPAGNAIDPDRHPGRPHRSGGPDSRDRQPALRR
jgi:hypothetical protein